VARLFTFLIVDAPDQPQQLILWDTLEITVGRAPDRDVVVAHAEVSRQHAVFRLEGQTYTIADLHTSNGTFVNGARVSQHALRPDDVVELGPARISFRQATESPKGKHVRFASQLKGFSPLGDGDADGGRTVLGLTGPGGNAAFDGSDYGDRLPSGEPQFEWTPEGAAGEGAEGAAAVVDLDPVLDASLEELELASFEDEELAALEDKPDGAPAGAPRAQRAQARAPAPPAPEPVRAPAPAAAPVRAAAPAPPRPAAPPVAPRAAAPAPARVAAEAVRTPELERPASARTPAAAPSAEDAPTRAVLTLEVEGPRAALKAVLGALLDRDLEIGPLRLRLRRPS
jgi:hypothetical protein